MDWVDVVRRVVPRRIVDLMAVDWLEAVRLSGCDAFVTWPSRTACEACRATMRSMMPIRVAAQLAAVRPVLWWVVSGWTVV